MKKLITFVLLMLGVGVNVVEAQDTYTVVGENLGDQALTWTETDTFGDMAQVGETTTYSITFKEVKFTSTQTFAFKVVKDHSFDNAWPSGYNNNYTHSYDAGVYDITITFNTSDSSIGLSDVGRMYIVKSTNNFSNHTVGDLMDYADGVHSVTFDATANTSFLIVPSWALNSDQTAISNDKWNYVICPVANNWYTVVLQHMAGSVSTSNNEKKWYFAEDANYTVVYNSSASTFTIDAKKEYAIGSAGWSTYSIGKEETSYGFTISDADAYYVSEASESKATLTHIASGAIIPTGAGIMVNGSKFTMETTGTNGTTLTDNMLVGTSYHNDYDLWRDGQYVLKEIDGKLGFYMVDMNGSDKRIAPHKAYLDTNGATVRSFIGFNDETNSINTAVVQQTNGVVYTLSGQRVARLQKGLFIIDGKKVIIK